VTHVHGAIGVGDESDGYAECWYLPEARNIPTGFALEGTWYDFFKDKAAYKFGTNWGPGFATFQYPNLNRASTIWYHDHALGMTRLNLYAGPAGFYIIRGGPAGDDSVRDSRTGTPAILPGPAPKENDNLSTASNKTGACYSRRHLEMIMSVTTSPHTPISLSVHEPDHASSRSCYVMFVRI
jgi:spore coat protein A, manganese oxidase